MAPGGFGGIVLAEMTQLGHTKCHSLTLLILQIADMCNNTRKKIPTWVILQNEMKQKHKVQ